MLPNYSIFFYRRFKNRYFFRSCFKFIPRQGLNLAGTYLLEMIILFLNKFKTASKYIVL